MGTRSTIALEYADGTVDQIYCHWDGYLEHNGELLLEHYMDPFVVQKMMGLGDMSSLDEDLDGCVFYARDRGESIRKARRFKDFDAYKKEHDYQEYEYILRTDGHWYVSFNDEQYVALEDAIADRIYERHCEEDGDCAY
jgi:hypothetical protein